MDRFNPPGIVLGDTLWKNLIGKRVLVFEFQVEGGPTLEYRVIEVSPSGTRVKFENDAGRTFWTDHRQYRPLEILP